MNFRKSMLLLQSAAIACALGITSAVAQTNLEFIQWWEPELPAGALRGIMDDFEAKNPGIKVTLVSGPYANTRDQIVVGAASGTLSDVVGLDGAWVNDLAKQGAIAPLDDLLAASDLDPKEVAAIIKVDGKGYMFPVASFVYPVFVNLDLLKAAGVEAMPANRTEFVEAARKLTDASKNQYGWVLPLSLQAPNGIQNDVMSWVWASGKSMLKDGKPDLTNQDVVGTLEYIKSMYDEGLISPGAFAKKEQDKVEEFVNGRVAMMVDSLAHINLIRERSPDLKFGITALPAVDGYDGPRGTAVRVVGHRRQRAQRAQGGGLQAGRLPDERRSERQARVDRERLPRQREGQAGLRRLRRAVRHGVRDLSDRLSRQRVRWPAGRRGADAPAG